MEVADLLKRHKAPANFLALNLLGNYVRGGLGVAFVSHFTQERKAGGDDRQMA